ncbi:hypothetical protein FKM82_006817 [Ascaphus truei]
MKNIMYFGGSCPALSALLRPPFPTLQPPLDIKQFFQFSMDNAAAVNLFPNFTAKNFSMKREDQRAPLDKNIRLDCVVAKESYFLKS